MKLSRKVSRIMLVESLAACEVKGNMNAGGTKSNKQSKDMGFTKQNVSVLSTRRVTPKWQKRKEINCNPYHRFNTTRDETW